MEDFVACLSLVSLLDPTTENTISLSTYVFADVDVDVVEAKLSENMTPLQQLFLWTGLKSCV